MRYYEKQHITKTFGLLDQWEELPFICSRGYHPEEQITYEVFGPEGKTMVI
jgi:hypothetical protein